MRNLLKAMKDNLNEASKLEYLDNLKSLGDYCPESKKEELNKVIEVVKTKWSHTQLNLKLLWKQSNIKSKAGSNWLPNNFLLEYLDGSKKSDQKSNDDGQDQLQHELGGFFAFAWWVGWCEFKLFNLTLKLFLIYWLRITIRSCLDSTMVVRFKLEE